MKRLAAMTLALWLLAGSALAQPLRVLETSWGGSEEYREVFPDRPVEIIQAEYDDKAHSNARQFLLDNPQGWDVAMIWSNECDLDTLEKAGLLMDLSGEQALASRVGNAYEPIRQAVCRDGKVLAVPAGLFGAVMQLGMYGTVQTHGEVVDVLGPLGLTLEDAPSTFGELSAFAQRYMEIPKKARKGTVFHIDAAASDSKSYFLAYLIELYTAQYADSTGAVNYDTPAFRQGLADLDAMATALKAEPKITYGKGGRVYGVVHDASSNLLPSIQVKLLYLGVGDNRSVPAKLGMLVINAHTQHKEEAVAFVQWSVGQRETQRSPLLLQNLDYEALARRAYDEDIEAQIYQKEAQEVIDRLIRERDSGEYPRYYPREAFHIYGETVAPRLTFPLIPWVDNYAVAKQYTRGKLDQDGLIRELNRMAAEYWAD